MMTNTGQTIDDRMVANKFTCMVNQFFKILPIKESGDPSLKTYLMSLQREMLGFQSLITAVHDDDRYLTLLCILQYFIDHVDDPELTVAVVKSDVFRAINILNKLKTQYASEKE